MRRHRTALRKAICEPLIQKRQEELAANLQNSMKEKSGKTIASLRAVFHPNDPVEGNTITSVPQSVDMEEENEEVDQASTPEPSTVEKQNKKKGNQKSKKIVLQKSSNKQLVWFS